MLFSQIVSILALGSTVSATTYAAFFSDSKCTKDKTKVDFSVDNPGCFSVGNRQYVKYHGTNAQCFSLIKSPKAGCNCQFDCVEGASSDGSPVDSCGPVIIPDGACHYIGQSKSLRYIGGSCPQNTCHESKRSVFENDMSLAEELANDPDQDTDTITDDYGYVDEQPDVEKKLPTIAVRSEDDVAPNEVVETIFPRGHGEPGIGYYQLCQDKYCLKGCSIDFRTTNPGCFQGAKYQSLNIGGPCQSSCHAVDTDLGCTVLPKDITDAKSLRLVNHEKCDPNNCGK